MTWNDGFYVSFMTSPPFWSFAYFLQDFASMRNDKTSCNYRSWTSLRADTVKHGLLTIKCLAWSRVFHNKYIPPGLDSEVLTHLSLGSTLIFIYLP